MPKNTQVSIPRPESDRFPTQPSHDRTPMQRLPDLKHLLPAWYPKDAFLGDKYPQQLGDNNPNYDQIAKRIEQANIQIDKDPHANYFYKQEAPIERPDRTSSYKPNPEKGIQPRPENQRSYQHTRRPDSRKGDTIGGQFSNGINPNQP